MVSIQPEELESSLAEIRRAFFSASVANIRERALSLPDPGNMPFLEVVWEADRGSHCLIHHLLSSPTGNPDSNAGPVPLITGNLRHFPRGTLPGNQGSESSRFNQSFS
jgi:hypothetical protein